MMRFTISSILATSLAVVPALAQTIQLTLPTNPPITLSDTSIDPSATLGFDLPTLTGPDQSETSVTGCPTIHVSKDICSTCMTIQCVVPFTITAGCECPEPALTIYDPHPCAKGCDGLGGAGGGCQTSYTVVHPTSCGSSSGGGGSSTTSSGHESAASSVTSSSASSAESGSITTIASTDTSSTPVSTVPPTSSTSTAGAGRLTPFRLW